MKIRFILLLFSVFTDLFLFFCPGVNGSKSVHDLQWLPCQFVDEKVHINEEGHTETKYIHREAVLQFGNVGDSPLHPTITFLITGKQKSLEDVKLLFPFLFK